MSPKPDLIRYVCVLCDASAQSVDGQIVRTCEHEDAPVAAFISATATGESKVAA